MGYDCAPDAQIALNVRSGLMVAFWTAVVADCTAGATKLPSLFWGEGCAGRAAWGRERPPSPVARGGFLTFCPPPPLPLPPRLVAGQEIVESLPSFQFGADSTRNLEKFAVVPEESERR